MMVGWWVVIGSHVGAFAVGAGAAVVWRWWHRRRPDNSADQGTKTDV